VPGADVREAPAEALPWPDQFFDAALAQLVVNFMRDAAAGVGEMRRVVRTGGAAAACTWDYGEMPLLRLFWEAAGEIDPAAPDERTTMPYQTRQDLEELWAQAGFGLVETGKLTAEARYTDFDDFWQPLTAGVGPAGAFCVSLESSRQAALRQELFERLGRPDGAFALSARAWAVRGVR
jgi:SAM-dependent methyltransferase